MYKQYSHISENLQILRKGSGNYLIHIPQFQPHPFSLLSLPSPLMRPEKACGCGLSQCGQPRNSTCVSGFPLKKHAYTETWKPRDLLVMPTPCLNKR